MSRGKREIGGKAAWALVIGAMLCGGVATAGVAEDIVLLQPGEWYEIADSRLSEAGVFPEPLPPGNTGVDSVISAWSGGVYDTKRRTLLIWGGGHADYSGNEIYAFDMGTSFTWSRIWGPTPVADIPTTGCHQAYPDGNPSSRHTYNHLAYLPQPYDAIYNLGGSLWKDGAPAPYNATWHFNLANLQWQDKGEIADNPAGGSAAYDPTKALIYARGRYGMFEYDPANGTWTKRHHDGAGLWSFPTGDIDPINRKMLLIGGGALHEFNIDTYTYATHSAADLVGDTEILGATSPGFVYDPASQRFVAWSGESASGIRPQDVYVVDPVSLVVERRAPVATSTVIPTDAAKWGTYGRWRYVPSKNVFVLVNSISENVFVYRLSPGESGPDCGDGNCDAGEDPSSCCDDCDVSDTSVCCDNVPYLGDCCSDSHCPKGGTCDAPSHRCVVGPPGDGESDSGPAAGDEGGISRDGGPTDGCSCDGRGPSTISGTALVVLIALLTLFRRNRGRSSP